MILPYFNFAKTKRRTTLFLEFLDRCKNLTNIRIVIAEAAVDEFTLAKSALAKSKLVFLHLRYKLDFAYFCKENLIYVAIKELTLSPLSFNWKYVCWIDADMTFANNNWVKDTLKELQRSHFVQLFDSTIIMGPSEEPLVVKQGFAFLTSLSENIDNIAVAPGLAMACTRWAFEMTATTLFDYVIVGGGDHLLLIAITQNIQLYLQKFKKFNISSTFDELVMRDAKRFKENNITLSYIKGAALSHWHGKLKDRLYSERWHFMAHFDPNVDLVRNEQGLLNLSNRGKLNKTNLANYFIRRNDDNMQL